MSKKENANVNKVIIVNAAQSDTTRVAIANMGAQGSAPELRHFDIDSNCSSNQQKMSNIYKCVVTDISPHLCAVFIAYGADRHGFLPFSNISSEYFNSAESISKQPTAAELQRVIKPGQELVVQLEKEERGNKGAAFTTFISLAGSYIVLMPNSSKGGGVSRQIEGADRTDLKEKLDKLDIPDGMSVIIRTAGIGCELEELQWDLTILLRYWEAVKKSAIAKPGPYLIRAESNLTLRTVRDHLRKDINEIIIDDEKTFNEVVQFLELVAPDFVSKVQHYQHATPIFSYYQLEEQVETAYQHNVSLKSGGSIVIEQTEAMVTIDVNSARSTRGSNIEETAFHTNLEAADEIARQIRFRDLSGLIVIDFIDMMHSKSRRAVEDRLAEAMREDRARIQTTSISRLGLLEMSRQRLRKTLTRMSKITCPRCEGQGIIRSVESLANSVIHTIQDRQAKLGQPLHFTVQCPLDLCAFLSNEKRAEIEHIEHNNDTKITIIPNQHLQTPHYILKQAERKIGANNSGKLMASYQRIKQQQPDTSWQCSDKSQSEFDEPVINQYLSMPTKKPNSDNQSGLFERLAKRWFSSSDDTENKPATAEKKKATQHKPNTSKQSPRKKPEQNQRKNTCGGDDEQNKDGAAATRRGKRGGRRQPQRNTGNQARSEPTRSSNQPEQLAAPKAVSRSKTKLTTESKPKTTASKPKTTTSTPKTTASTPEKTPTVKATSTARPIAETASANNAATQAAPKRRRKTLSAAQNGAASKPKSLSKEEKVALDKAKQEQASQTSIDASKPPQTTAPTRRRRRTLSGSPTKQPTQPDAKKQTQAPEPQHQGSTE